MRKLKPIEYIFSITNNDVYKQITILGIPIKFNRLKKYKPICDQLPVEKNKIVFMNYLGKPYGCNPKYIAEEIIKRKLPFDMVWLGRNIDDDFKKSFPEGIRFVKYKSPQCLLEVASAGFWITNYHFIKLMTQGIVKKPDQYYIQTWHGSLGIKKIEKNVQILTEDESWTKFAQQNSRSVDCWVSNSKFESNVYKEAFWDVEDEKIKEFGHPRNDIFFFSDDRKKQIIDKVYNELNIPRNKKILLYAPSYRVEDCCDNYNIDVDKIIAALSKKFDGEWVVVSRMHPHFKKRYLENTKLISKTINADKYPDMQELLLASECIITDYSSCIFDFMLSYKPGFIFAADIEKYNTERGFYYPLETTPFPIATNNNELIKNIEDFDIQNYKLKVKSFLEEKGCIEDGLASKKVVDLLEQIINKDKVLLAQNVK